MHAPGTKNKSPLAFMYSAVLVGVLLLSYDEWIWKGVDMEKERQQQQHKGRIWTCVSSTALPINRVINVGKSIPHFAKGCNFPWPLVMVGWWLLLMPVSGWENAYQPHTQDRKYSAQWQRRRFRKVTRQMFHVVKYVWSFGGNFQGLDGMLV